MKAVAAIPLVTVAFTGMALTAVKPGIGILVTASAPILSALIVVAARAGPPGAVVQ